jgi:quercetin dioxygenase-like cupin family protein
MRTTMLLSSVLLLAACAAEVPREPIAEFSVTKSADQDIEVIVSEARIPPNTTLPRHYHHGEEIVLLLEGSAVHVEEGKPDRQMAAGERVVIPAGAIHAPRIGPDGAHIVVIYLNPAGAEVTVSAPVKVD